MPHDIRPLSSEDLADLSRFLTEGFHAPPGSNFAAVDVLRWKYLEPRGPEAGEAPRSLLARDTLTGAVVGHVGVCPSRWHGGGLPAEGVTTLHMMDWLSSASGAGVGATLMRRVHQASETQYGLGGSESGRGVIDRGGYGLVQRVPVYTRVLRPLHRLRDPGHGPAGRGVRALKDLAGVVLRPGSRAPLKATLEGLAGFTDEIKPILESYETRAIFTTREPSLLNYMLGFPGRGLTGWRIVLNGRPAGFALLAVVPRPGGVRVGRVADWVLGVEDDGAWHASAVALAGELKRQGADTAQAFASTPWSVRALEASGFTATHRLDFRLRDRQKRLPQGVPFHLTPLEADYAYV